MVVDPDTPYDLADMIYNFVRSIGWVGTGILIILWIAKKAGQKDAIAALNQTKRRLNYLYRMADLGLEPLTASKAFLFAILGGIAPVLLWGAALEYTSYGWLVPYVLVLLGTVTFLLLVNRGRRLDRENAARRKDEIS
jgi:hypothetical protein